MVSPRSTAAGHANPVTPQKRGYCDAYFKRLEVGTFELPRVDDEANHIVLSAADLSLLLGGIDLASVRRRKRYRRTA